MFLFNFPDSFKNFSFFRIRACNGSKYHNLTSVIFKMAGFVAVDVVIDEVPLGRETDHEPFARMIGLRPDGGESDNGERRLGSPRTTLTQRGRRGSGLREVLVLAHDGEDALPDLGSAADQPDSSRNVGPEQAKSEIGRADGVYLCAEGERGALGGCGRRREPANRWPGAPTQRAGGHSRGLGRGTTQRGSPPL